MSLSHDLKVNFAPKAVSYDAGSAWAVDLLAALARDPLFSQGWGFLHDGEEAVGEELIDAFRARNLAPENDSLQSYFLVAGDLDAQKERRSSYSATVDFGGPKRPARTLEVGICLDSATAKTLLQLYRLILDHTPVQHISLTEDIYRIELSPLGKRRRGIGWAGWVPFELMDDQVPAAEVIEPLAGGTFVANQINHWDVSNTDAVKRAQALELQLNDLGVLPTLELLENGSWGELR